MPDKTIDTEQPTWEGSLQPGSWWVAIRAVDQTGLWGKTTYRHLLIDPEAGAPVTPGPHRVTLTSAGGVNLTIDTTKKIAIPDVTVFPDRDRSDVAVGHQVSKAYDVTLDSSVGDVRTATITIPYQEQRLDGADPAGIRIYHFDESRGIWEPVGSPTVVNQQSHTVSTTVTHFSTYTAVAGGTDGAPDFGADWPVTPNWCRPPGTEADLDIALMIDASSSMLNTDPEEARYAAARELVEGLPASHRVSVSRFRDTARVRIEMTELDEQGRSEVLAAIGGSADGGTSLDEAVTGGVDALAATPLPGQPGVVFLLSDGGAGASSETIDLASQLGIPIFTFEFGPQPSSSSPMRHIADSTGGEYFYRAQLRAPT